MISDETIEKKVNERDEEGVGNTLSNDSENIFDSLATQKEEKKRINMQEVERMNLKGQISTELANKTKNKKLFGTTDQKDIGLVETWINDIIVHSGTELPKNMIKGLIHEMVLEITSYGKIHNLMLDEGVSEVMINSADEVWIEKKGQLILTNVKFSNEAEVMDLATKIASNVGRSVNNSTPIVDARLPDGSRVHIVIPPISMKGVTITIRKFFKEKLQIEDLINFGSITEEAASFLEEAVISRANIIVSGGTGSGKTTTLNIVSNFVPNDERIITVEDSAELQPNNEHVVALESRNANNEGQGSVTIRDLVKATLRMRPERIVVGEVRDGTAFDLMQAMNTGHDGTMATVHANDPDACIDRMDSLCQMADDVKMESKVLRKMIGQAIDIIVQITRLPDGSRKITHISEVTYDSKREQAVTLPIYIYKIKGKNGKGEFEGEFVFTGHIASKDLQDKFLKHNLNYFESVGLPKPEEKY